jgi:sigma-B regulation protein RsbU (phosphoserine phosphatase)
VLSTLNTALHEEYQRDNRSFCTATFGLLAPDADGFALSFASGGHADPLMIRADGTASYRSTPRGLLLGILPGTAYTATGIRLRPGDTLILYTDGLTEARTVGSGGRYGDEALLDFVRNLAPVTAAGVISAITGLLDSFGDGVNDDTAVLAIGVPLLAEEHPAR